MAGFGIITMDIVRFYAIMMHFMVTTALIWTRNTSIQSSIFYTDNSRFKVYNQAYIGLISVGLILTFVRMVYLGLFGGVNSVSSCFACA